MPQLQDARALAEVAMPASSADDEFRAPSNPVFRPAEYLSTTSRMASNDESCEPRDTEGEAVARRVDACIRENSNHSRLPRIDPHTVEFKKLDGSWGKFEQPVGCRADRTAEPPDSCWYKTYLDLKRLRNKALTESKSLERVVWETLTHEYAHHIIGNPDHGSRYFQTHQGSVRSGTQSCAD